jgi:hypothetical protein
VSISTHAPGVRRAALTLHAIMAGTGDPYAVLTPLRMGLLRGLHDGLAVPQLAERLGLTPDDTRHELAPVVAASLAVERDGGYRPAFWIADAEETHRIDAHARRSGRSLADALLTRWAEVEATYRELAIGRTWGLRELAFVLVGGRILDVGLLCVLAREGSLMPPAPARPGPGRPDARYYLWMIEGDPDHLGRYGQRRNALPWEGWALLTFGQYQLGEARNEARDALEAAARAVLAAGQAPTPWALAGTLGLPAVAPLDASRWAGLGRRLGAELLRIYRGREEGVRTLYAALRANTYLPNGFAEFFCWYDHLAYAHAIDALAAEGVLAIPASRFGAAIWYEGPGVGEF